MFLLIILNKERDKGICRKFILGLRKKPWHSLENSVLEKEKCMSIAKSNESYSGEVQWKLPNNLPN